MPKVPAQPGRSRSQALARVSAPGAGGAGGAEPALPSLLTSRAAPGPAAGLVTCATTPRDLEPVPDFAPDVREVWAPSFPPADLVGVAAGQFPALAAWRGEEGPRWRIVVSPGAIAMESHDLARLERTYERQLEARRKTIDLLANTEHARYLPAREITAWSRRSRARMFRAYSELDYGPLLARSGIPAMVTLTLPGDWLASAPDGPAYKKLIEVFKTRWHRAWGEPVAGLWKQEYQRRGAPHTAIFTVVPDGRTEAGQHFREWVSATWASVVAHPDPEQRRRHQLAGTGVDYATGLRSRDPRRIAVYFSKHGLFSAKEYQNEVPEQWQAPGRGPGRFWGYWGLQRCTASAELAPRVADAAARTLRRWARAQNVTRQATVRRVDTSTGLVDYRRVRRRVRRLRSGHGWVSLNDAPAFALDLARYLERAGP
jgi:hypothetical protein